MITFKKIIINHESYFNLPEIYLASLLVLVITKNDNTYADITLRSSSEKAGSSIGNVDGDGVVDLLSTSILYLIVVSSLPGSGGN